MTPAAEPLSLRLPRDLLVLQPMQGHLDVEPVLLAPGLRCVIGSAEGSAIRLMKSALVQPQHCIVEVVGRKTLLTEWEPGATWLNDRLVSEPRELGPGDRIAIGPFDFRVRPASAEELLYAKLVERDSGDANKIEDMLRLKRAIDSSGRDQNTTLAGTSTEPALDLIGDLLRETSEASDDDTHERFTQHVSKLLGDLQSQVLSLQEKEAERNEQLRSPRGETHQRRPEAGPPESTVDAVPKSAIASLDSIPAAVRPEYEQVLHLLKAERDQLDQDRSQLADEQAKWHTQQRDWSQRLQSLESQLAELETQRQAVLEDRDICRTLTAELMRDEARMAEWEDRLRREERELAVRRNKLAQDERDFLTQLEQASNSAAMSPEPAMANSAVPRRRGLTLWQLLASTTAESDVLSHPGRPIQTWLTLVAFSLAALFLSGSLGEFWANTTLGWGSAILAALSTVDLLIRRCFSTGR